MSDYGDWGLGIDRDLLGDFKSRVRAAQGPDQSTCAALLYRT
jgi:hypothetical protein